MDERLLCLFGATLLNAMIETGNFLYIGMHGALDKTLYARHNRIMKAMYEDFVSDCELVFKEKYGQDESLFPKVEEDNSSKDDTSVENENNSFEGKKEKTGNVSASGKRVVKVKSDLSGGQSKESSSVDPRLSRRKLLRKKLVHNKK